MKFQEDMHSKLKKANFVLASEQGRKQPQKY